MSQFIIFGIFIYESYLKFTYKYTIEYIYI